MSNPAGYPGVYDSSGRQVTADYKSDLLHDGLVWSCTRVNPALANNGTDYYIWTSGTTRHKHVMMTVSGGGDMLKRGYMLPVIAGTLTGTLMPSFNRNTGAVTVTDARIYHSGSMTSNGTLMFSNFLPGGQKQAATGVVSDTAGEWIVPATVGTFLLTITNKSGGEKYAGVAFNWYEET
jgi:hypothetical protein